MKILLIILAVNVFAKLIHCKNVSFTCELKSSTITFGDLRFVKSCCEANQHISIEIDKVDLMPSNQKDGAYIECFIAENCNIIYIPRSIRTQVFTLAILVITKSQLKHVSAKNIENLQTLKYLDLSNNKIESLNENVFANNTNLMFIKLENNAIKYIYPNAFRANHHYRYLNLLNNSCINRIGENETEVQNLIMKIKKDNKCSIRSDNNNNVDKSKDILTSENDTLSKNEDFSTNAINGSTNQQHINPTSDSFMSFINTENLNKFVIVLLIIIIIILIYNRKSQQQGTPKPMTLEQETPSNETISNFTKNQQKDLQLELPQPNYCYQNQASYEEIGHNLESEINREVEDFYAEIFNKEEKEPETAESEIYSAVYKS